MITKTERVEARLSPTRNAAASNKLPEVAGESMSSFIVVAAVGPR